MPGGHGAFLKAFMSFSKLGLSDALLRAVAETGYEHPTPIQQQAIPLVLSGTDLLAGAQTGTGKTAAFVLPLLQLLSTQAAPPPLADDQRVQRPGATPPRRIRALVVVPTRELAAQVHESIQVYAKFTGLTSYAMFGGVSINPQITLLKKGVDILVATPGRLLDHHGQRTLDLSAVQFLVLDEADRMLDMGFIPDIRRILGILPPKRQNLLFSATFAEPIRALAQTLLKNPKHVQVTPQNTTVEAVQQTVHPVDAGRKIELLIHLIKEGNWFQVLVFTRTKHGANKLAARLEKQDIPALAIHGNKSQNARTRALAEFKTAKLQVLVATDIAARGLDIEQLPHVVNFDLPHVPEDYVHRIGRTGRAGAQGEAISLVSGEEAERLRDIERFIRRKLPRQVITGFEAGSAPRLAPEDIDADDRPPRHAVRRSASKAPAGNRSAPARDGRSPTGGQRRDAVRSTGGHRAAGSASAGHAAGAGAQPRAERSDRNDGRVAQNRAGTRSTGSAAAGTEARAPSRNSARPAARSDTDRTAGQSNGRQGQRRDADNGLVRNNLPPGWTASATRRPR